MFIKGIIYLFEETINFFKKYSITQVPPPKPNKRKSKSKPKKPLRVPTPYSKLNYYNPNDPKLSALIKDPSKESKTYVPDSPPRNLDFSVIPKNPNVYSVWVKHWGDTSLRSKDQYWRRQRSYETTPIYISINDLNGKFLGSEGEVYDTTLTSCDCMDFLRQGIPCKHIYRLFYDLERNNSLNINIGLANAEIAMKMKCLPKSSILLFQDISRTVDTRVPYYSKKTKDIKNLLEVNLIHISDNEKDYNLLLNRMTKDEIILSLAKKTVNGYKVSWSKVKLIDWVINTQQVYLKKEFKNVFRFEINPDALPISEKMVNAY